MNQHIPFELEEYKIGPGDSMALLFQRAGLSSRLLYELTSTSKEIQEQLTKVKPGDKFQLGFDEQHQLVQIKRQLIPYKTFLITKSPSGYTSKIEQKVNYQFNYAEANIQPILECRGAYLTPNQIMELAGIFGWDIDFAHDIRKGDSFKILYQEKIVEGEVIGRGQIIAAIFTNQGDTFKAILETPLVIIMTKWTSHEKSVSAPPLTFASILKL